jgi:hypothetical protein
MSTALNIIKSAMRKAGVLTKSESPSADEANDGLEMLNDLLASLSNDSMLIPARVLESFSLNTATDYTIGSGGDFNTIRPIKIVSAYVRSGTIDYTLDIVTDENYATIPLKNTGGIPAHLNYTNAYPLATIKIYPAPTAGYTLYLLSEKQLSSFTLNQTVDLAPGWRRMLIHNLAVELAPEYGQSVPPEVYAIARESKGEIKSAIMAARPMQWENGLSDEGNIYSGWWN